MEKFILLLCSILFVSSLTFAQDEKEKISIQISESHSEKRKCYYCLDTVDVKEALTCKKHSIYAHEECGLEYKTCNHLGCKEHLIPVVKRKGSYYVDLNINDSYDYLADVFVKYLRFYKKYSESDSVTKRGLRSEFLFNYYIEEERVKTRRIELLSDKMLPITESNYEMQQMKGFAIGMIPIILAIYNSFPLLSEMVGGGKANVGVENINASIALVIIGIVTSLVSADSMPSRWKLKKLVKSIKTKYGIKISLGEAKKFIHTFDFFKVWETVPYDSEKDTTLFEFLDRESKRFSKYFSKLEIDTEDVYEEEITKDLRKKACDSPNIQTH